MAVRLQLRQIIFALVYLGLVFLQPLHADDKRADGKKPCHQFLESAEARFLHQKYPQLHKSHQVAKASESSNSLVAITQWLESLGTTIQKLQTHKTSRERFKRLILDKYVTKAEEISESFFQLQIRIAREQGHGNITLTPEDRVTIATTAVKDQQTSLSYWLDYFLSENSKSYPIWVKYWSLMSVVQMGQYDPETGKFSNRSKGQALAFPELNEEAFAIVSDAIVKKINKEPQSLQDSVFLGFLEGGSFEKLYGRAIQLATANKADLTSTEGQWVTYKQGSDPQVLVNALQGQNTGWCTAGHETAKAHLSAGDFHVFYSKDKAGQLSVPRVAIRMEGDRIAEIRGVAAHQNLDSVIAGSDALKEKLPEFGGEGEAYFQKVEDMKRLTGIETRSKKGEALSADDLRFLYEIDHNIIGFGSSKDPRIDEIKSTRNFREDLAHVFDCKPNQISLTQEESLRGDIVYHYGALVFQGKSAKGLKLPQGMRGGLNLNELESAEGLKLPETFNGTLELKGLQSAEGLKLPQTFNGDLDVSGLQSAEGLELPKTFNGHLYLNGLQSAEGLKLPETFNGNLNLRSLQSAVGLVFPKKSSGYIDLNGLQSAEGLILPETIDGDLYLNGLQSAVGLELPKTFSGTLGLNGLQSAEGLILPETFNGNLNLRSLQSAVGLVFPKKSSGYIDLNGLQSAEGLELPETFSGILQLFDLRSAEKLTLPKTFRGILELSGLRSAKGLIFPEIFNGALWLSRLQSAEGLILPKTFNGDLYLHGLQSTVGLMLPEVFNGTLYLSELPASEMEKLRLPKNLKLKSLNKRRRP